jgi:hypothetical protein
MAVTLKTSSKPVMMTEMVKVSDLIEYANNPRNNDAAVPDMVSLIEQFGFRVPILKRGNEIVDGHLRTKAARKMGMEEIPAIDVGDMDEAEVRALRIALNKSVEWAEWDRDKLNIEFDFIKSGKLDLAFTGFGKDEIAKITKSAEADVNKAAKALAKSKNADAGKPADPNYVSLTFHMAAPVRDKVMRFLEKVRKENELGNVSQALAHVATENEED